MINHDKNHITVYTSSKVSTAFETCSTYAIFLETMWTPIPSYPDDLIYLIYFISGFRLWIEALDVNLADEESISSPNRRRIEGLSAIVVDPASIVVRSSWDRC